jgi:hypothetical protein
VSAGRSAVIIERNRLAAQRMGRILSASMDLGEVHLGERPSDIRPLLTDRTALAALEATDLDAALEWVRGPFPKLRLLAWSQGSLEGALQVARHEPQLQSVVGWPAHQSLPRAWELALAARRSLGDVGKGPRLPDLLCWGASVIKWSPRTGAERDDTVAEVERHATTAGAGSRMAERVGLLTHELLMNALYDAPVDEAGRPLFAQDRKADVSLPERMAPTLRLGFDGLVAGLEITDPFGRLERRHVLDSILRGLAGAREGGGQLLDTSHGGAGLGLFRVYEASTVVIVDVRPREYTRVMALVDLDANPRSARGQHASLHLFFPAGDRP